MPTIGRIIAKTNNIPLKLFVNCANETTKITNGIKCMTPTGALTKAGRDIYFKEKVMLGLPKNASWNVTQQAIEKKIVEVFSQQNVMHDFVIKLGKIAQLSPKALDMANNTLHYIANLLVKAHQQGI